jgi:hypothetical protein
VHDGDDMKLALLLPVFFVGCAGTSAPNPVQQAADAETLIACVQGDWGKPLQTIADDCAHGAIQVAVDVVADILVLTSQPKEPYASDPQVRDALAAKASK